MFVTCEKVYGDVRRTQLGPVRADNTIDCPVHCVSQTGLLYYYRSRCRFGTERGQPPSKTRLTRPTEYGRKGRGSLCAAVIDCHKLKIQ